MLDVPRLSSERLCLEPLGCSHSAGMFSMWSRPEVCVYSGPADDLEGQPITLPARTPADSDRIIDFFTHGRTEGTRFRWAVLTGREREFVGAIGFNSLGECSELAYHAHPDYWGRGLMSEAATTSLDWLRRRGDCSEVEVFIDPQNKASIKLALRLGFIRTGESAEDADRYVLTI